MKATYSLDCFEQVERSKNIPLQLRALRAWFIQNIMLEFYFEEMKYLQNFLYKNKFDWSFDPSPDISEVFSICTLWSKSNNLIWKSTFLVMFVWSGIGHFGRLSFHCYYLKFPLYLQFENSGWYGLWAGFNYMRWSNLFMIFNILI